MCQLIVVQLKDIVWPLSFILMYPKEKQNNIQLRLRSLEKKIAWKFLKLKQETETHPPWCNAIACDMLPETNYTDG